MPQDLQPITGPLTWKAVDFPDDRSWVRPFERGMLAELESAAKGLLQSRAPLKDIVAADIDLPQTDALLRQSYDDMENGCGFSLLSGLPVDDWGLDLCRAVQCIVGTRYGLITKQNREGDFLLDVINRNVTHGTQNRGYHSNAFLDFHNDGANTVALLCMETAAEGGESVLVSAVTVYNEILKLRPELLQPLMRGYFHHRRNQRAPEDPPLMPYRTPVFCRIGGVFHCCYSRISIDSSKDEGLVFSPEEEEALDFIDAQLQRPDLQIRMYLRKGDLQLVNNFVVLHSRTAFIDKPGHPRHLLRLWLDDPRSRYNGPNKMDFYLPEESRFMRTVGYEALASSGK
jgi:hypothetical protein